MKKYISLVLMAGLFAVGCAKTTSSSSKSISRAGTAGNGAPTQVDSQAQAIGLNVVWESTEIKEDDPTVTVSHTFSVNGQKQTITHAVSTNVAKCSDRARLEYGAEVNSKAVNNVYSAIGYTGCWDDSYKNHYLGISVMAWGTAGTQLVQEFVLMNLTAKGESIMIQKQLSNQSNGTYLPDWVSYLFNE